MALLSVTDLHKSYLITKTVQQPVLKGVTIEFRSGDLVALLGESGCGKSTLINILGGLDRDYYGEVRLQNRVLGDFTERELDDYRKKDVGLIFQNYNLIPNMNIRENVDIAMTIAEILVGQALADELSDSYAALIGRTAVVSYGDNTIELTVSGIYEDTSDSSNRYKAFMARDDFLALTGVVEDSAANILYITAEDAGSVAAVINDLTAFGYTVEQQDSVINTILEYIDLGTGVLTAVGGISMLISAIMIFIVLYISVVERTKEIGILRAIGGRKKDVRTMFLAEAGMLGLTAGLLGAFLCLVISIVANIVCLSVLSHAVISYNPLYYLRGWRSR